MIDTTKRNGHGNSADATSPHPTCSPPITENIPTTMKAEPRWVCWHFELRGEKWTKTPINARTGRNASSTDSTTWTTFDTAVTAFHRGGVDGIGFVLGDGWSGIDLDDHLDGDGRTTAFAQDVLDRLCSFHEVSPSGEGIKLFLRADIEHGHADHKNGIEIYGSGRYFTVTGRRLNDSPNEVEHRQIELGKLLSDLKPPRANAASPSWQSLSDHDKAKAALDTLSPSRADGYSDWIAVGMALCSVDASLLDAWDQWSARSAKHDDQCCRAKWGSFAARSGYTLASLVFWADADAPGWRDRYRLAPARSYANGNFENVTLRNFRMVNVETDEGKDKWRHEPLPITTIAANIAASTDGWPRRVCSSLFIPNAGSNGISWLPKTDSLFGYLGQATGTPPEFKDAAGFHTKQEIFAFLTRTATNYFAVEELPHEPPMLGHFYACNVPQAGDGDMLRQLIDRFSPETDIDRDLILAAFATPFWGGQSGARPALCITSDAGKGCGKSTLAACIGQLAGGALDVSANEDIAVVKQRMLSPIGLTKRVVWLDNVKSLKLSWAELESLITTPVISGKQMFVGEGQRPNNLTFVLTMNGVSLSTDMAQRSVIIKLRRPDYSGTWAEETRNFIEQHRQRLVADVIGFLHSPPNPLDKFSRWGDWERDILARLPEPTEAQAVIRERQVGVDVDGEESALIEEFFAKQITALGYDAKTDRVFIPSRTAARWYGWATNERMTVAKASRTLKQRITEGQLRRLLECGRRDIGRGFEFWGDDATGETYLHRDLEEQIKNRGDTQAA